VRNLIHGLHGYGQVVFHGRVFIVLAYGHDPGMFIFVNLVDFFKDFMKIIKKRIF